MYIQKDPRGTNTQGSFFVFQDKSESGSLPGVASLFTAELYTIKTVVGRILEVNPYDKKYTLFSDSQRALLTLKSRTSTSPIVQDIKL